MDRPQSIEMSIWNANAGKTDSPPDANSIEVGQAKKGPSQSSEYPRN